MHTIRNLAAALPLTLPEVSMTSFPRKHAHAENNSPPPRRCCVPAKKKKNGRPPSEAQLQRFRLRRAVPSNRAFPEKRLGFSGTTALSHARLSEYGMFMFQFGGLRGPFFDYRHLNVHICKCFLEVKCACSCKCLTCCSA